MRDIYATTLQLVDVGGGDPFEVACERAMAWAWRIENEQPNLSEQPSGRLPEDAGPDETMVEWWSALEGSARALELRLRHPDADDATLQWLATITVSDLEGLTRATVRLERGAVVHSVRPWRLDLRAPSIVLELMCPPLVAYAGSLELTAGPRVLRPGDADSFVADVLRADGRALPILIASSSVWTTFVQLLAKALAGLVQVVRIANQEAEDALGEALRGSGYVVPRGGLRLYWPGFGLAGAPRRHPYWTASQIRQGRDPAQSVLRHLVNLLAPISTGRVPADPGVLRARREWLTAGLRVQREREAAQRERARRERQKASEALAEARGHEDARDELNTVNAQLAEAAQALEATEKERDAAVTRAEEAAAAELKVVEESLGIEARAAELAERVAQADAENSALRQSVKTLSIYRDDSSGEGEDDGEDVPDQVSSWEEVAEHLPEIVGPGFAITHQAEECAEGKGRYPHATAMWEALRSLERIGRIYNELGADLGMRFDEFASQEAGLDVALQDSTYEDDCRFSFEGQEYSRLPHVKIDDAKAPNEVGRIYFALDPERNRLVVDWFGTKPDRPTKPRGGVQA